MRIAVASDHAGFELKRHVVELLTSEGHEVQDAGPDSDAPIDYPLSVAPAARIVADGRADAGVLVCGSGVGASIVANKVAGIRAVNAHDREEAELSRRHNDANVLALSGRRLTAPQADDILAGFLATGFEGGRHARRVQEIAEMEAATT